MRLTFSNNDYRNTNLFDEQGGLWYRVDTPFALSRKTTITKYPQGGTSSQPPHILAVIEWKWLGGPVIHFKGRTIEGDTLLTKQLWSSGRYFKGPDGLTYKWKIRSTNCWLKSEGSNVELAKYHKHNAGIMKPSHPPYLEISSSVTHMLDEIITTFLYAEKLSEDARRQRRRRNIAAVHLAAGGSH